MSNEGKSPMNPPGFVPIFGQGLRAKESQLGAVGTKEWLKSIKLHKYWPLISHWSYWQMMALTEENIEYNIRIVGGTEITCGAQGKLLRSIQELRERKARLKKIIEILESYGTSMDAILTYVSQVVHTPFPTSQEDCLPTLVVHCVQKIKEYTKLNGHSSQSVKVIEKIVWAIKQNPVLNRADNHLKRLPLLWEIESIVSQYSIASSRILPGILSERNRNISMDSGFDENSDPMVPRVDSSLWPTGMNAVMFNLQMDNEYRNALFRSPFYPNAVENSEDQGTRSWKVVDKTNNCKL